MKTSRLNKFISCTLLTGLLAGMAGWIGTASAAITSSFPDVKSDNLHVPAIEYLKKAGIVNGYPDGTFKPDQTINRAEALKIIFLARQKLALPDPTASTPISFPDVKKTDWFFDYVQKAFDLKIVEGYTDGKFKPANEITTGESLKIVLLALVKNYQSPSVDKDPFTDVKTTDWYAPYAAYALNRQFIDMNDDGSYGPTRKITRAEFAELVYRVEFTEENKQDRYPLSQNWAYCNNYQQSYKVKFPPTWTKLVAGDQMIFWRKDVANSQISFARIYPNSAVAIMAIDKNPQGLDLQKYLDTLEYGQGSNKQVITLNGLSYASIFIEQSGLQDSYFALPNGQILAVYAQVGGGELSSRLKEEIRYLIGSIRASSLASADPSENCLDSQKAATVTTGGSGTVSSGTAATTSDQLVSDILKEVLIQGQSQSVLDQLTDEILISTDSIGIGTGPVDYYYSAKIDLTMKIDRNSSTILATKTGKTSAF